MENASLWFGVALSVLLVSLFSYGLSRLKSWLAFLLPSMTVVSGLVAVLLTRILMMGWSAIALVLLGIYLIAVGLLSLIPASLLYFRARKQS